MSSNTPPPLKGTGARTIKDWVQFRQTEERRFDIRTLPADMQRVYKELAKAHGEEYALHTIFTIRTAVELHRAWHMTLLTSKILQQLKHRFRLRMTWSLGVFQLEFRISDGGAELYRKVPYDYDSEYQDIYMRVAIALMDGEIDIHQALIYQSETQNGVHTAKSGLFLRDFPGRLILYPLVASTCAVVFFNGDWTDFGIAALCGFSSGLVEMAVGWMGIGMLNDIIVGTVTGLIGGLFYRFGGQDVCLSSIFLGTLYWFFYGTAFVLGILEIIAGELETGVTRFIAVSVKTFVLCLGASFGLMVVGDAGEAWYQQSENCGRINLDNEWWRIPLYILCSVAVLGQYRFPIVRYWRALVTMVVGYVVQYELFKYFAGLHDSDNLDTAISNVFGSGAAVISACFISWYTTRARYYYDARILNPDSPDCQSCKGIIIYNYLAFVTKFENMVGLGRRSDVQKLDLEKKLLSQKQELEDPGHARREIGVTPQEENLIVETIVGTQDMNIWSVLMPALYQLVPGSMIAKLWFNYIFPPRLIETSQEVGDTGFFVTFYEIDEAANNVFAGLMIISTSLALGLPLGFAVIQFLEKVYELFLGDPHKRKSNAKVMRAKDRRAGMYSSPITKEMNPDSVAHEFRKAIMDGVTTEEQADEIFHAVDVDRSGSVDEGEVSYYMVKAGLTVTQIKGLFSSMDKDGNGEVSCEEFRRALMDKANASFLTPKKEVEAETPETTVAPPEKKEKAATTTAGSTPAPTETQSDKDEKGFTSVSLLAGDYGNTAADEGLEVTELQA